MLLHPRQSRVTPRDRLGGSSMPTPISRPLSSTFVLILLSFTSLLFDLFLIFSISNTNYSLALVTSLRSPLVILLSTDKSV